jgi:hypothetical protein
MCEVNWLLMLEYLKVLLSWPPIALVIAIIFITRFRAAINDFLNRLIEGNIFGQTLKAAPPHQIPVEVGVAEDRLMQAAAAKSDGGAPTQAQETIQLPPALANDPHAQAAVAYVRNNPAQTVIEYKRILFSYNSERLFNLIYGTQVALLEFLAFRHDQSTTLPQIAQFHREHQAKSGQSDYQLRDYVGFLVSYGVVSVEGSPDQQVYKISQHGVEFLSYIKASYPLVWNQRAW